MPIDKSIKTDAKAKSSQTVAKCDYTKTCKYLLN